MDSKLQARIDAMLSRDIAVGISFAAAMWITLVFTLIITARVVDDVAVVLVMAAAAVVLGIFNTLSLLSLIRRYRHERQHVYGEDLIHLDAMRAAKQPSMSGGGPE
jgi:uncharacterized membrane protein